MQKLYLYFFILNGIFISILSGFFSVIGFGLIFKSILIPISILAILLETSKILTSIYLHLYWKVQSKLIIFYLTIALIILGAINSLGVYSYLSKGYLDSFNSSEVSFTIDLSKQQIESKQESINTNKELKKEKELEKKRLNSELYSLSEIDKIDNRNKIKKLSNEITELSNKNERLLNEIAELKLSEFSNKKEINKIDTELGPIKYLALLIYKEDSRELIDKSMRIFIVILIIVFDPLAIISLIACISALGNKENKTKEPENKIETKEPENKNIFKKTITKGVNIINTSKDKLEELYKGINK